MSVASYAVVKSGGHQYRVTEGSQVRVDFMTGKVGDKVKLNQVLLVSAGSALKVGAPLLSGASVEATIKEQTRNEKIVVFHTRRRKNSKKTQGHKQLMTVLEINKIVSK